ncbi:MAG: alpha/beta hydrolase family protein [Acidimicrobiales bacterium]
MRWTRRRFLGLGAGAVALASCGDADGPTGGGAGASDEVEKPEVIEYGDAAAQRLELSRPPGDGLWPVVVLVHGGFWQDGFDLDLMRPLVPSLVAEGWAVANIDYRGVGAGGGWPATLDDAAAATDALLGIDDLDLGRLITLGHSAGGHLAVWLAARPQLPPGAPGSDPAVIASGAVAQAGVVDLVAAAEANLGGGATQSLLGGDPADHPDRYAAASPAALVPLGVPVELVHGVDDTIVALDQSRRYEATALAAGDQVTLTETAGDHFSIIDPNTDDWAACLAAARRLLDR